MTPFTIPRTRWGKIGAVQALSSVSLYLGRRLINEYGDTPAVMLIVLSRLSRALIIVICWRRAPHKQEIPDLLIIDASGLEPAADLGVEFLVGEVCEVAGFALLGALDKHAELATN
jgi:hypothetical protein